jgi:hypothetical protein
MFTISAGLMALLLEGLPSGKIPTIRKPHGFDF